MIFFVLDYRCLTAIQQGLVRIIQEELFFYRLQQGLQGLRFAGRHEATMGYDEDVAMLSSKIPDLQVMDQIFTDYEVASGAILKP